MSTKAKSTSIFDAALLVPALRGSIVKLDPRQLIRNTSASSSPSSAPRSTALPRSPR